jgi:hypothetical protein
MTIPIGNWLIDSQRRIPTVQRRAYWIHDVIVPSHVPTVPVRSWNLLSNRYHPVVPIDRRVHVNVVIVDSPIHPDSMWVEVLSIDRPTVEYCYSEIGNDRIVRSVGWIHKYPYNPNTGLIERKVNDKKLSKDAKVEVTWWSVPKLYAYTRMGRW